MSSELIGIWDYGCGIFTEDEVLSLIAAQGFDAPEIIYEVNPEVPVNIVFKSYPPPFSMIKKETLITIWVSLGEPEENGEDE